MVCTEEGKRSTDKIKMILKNEKPLGQIILEVSETKKRKARTAHLTVYSKKLHIALPDKWKKNEASYANACAEVILENRLSLIFYSTSLHLVAHTGQTQLNEFS